MISQSFREKPISTTVLFIASAVMTAAIVSAIIIEIAIEKIRDYVASLTKSKTYDLKERVSYKSVI